MNIAIIGCGGVAGAHLKALSKIQEVSLVVLYDLEKEKSIKLSSLTSKPTVISDTLVDAIRDCAAFIVCTPNNRHLPVIEEALSIKKIPFVCEKPLSCSLRDAERISLISNPMSIVSFNYRFNHVFSIIKNLEISGGVGRIISFSADFNKNSAFVRRNLTWRDSSTQGGSSGALGDLSCHLLDAFCWLTGEKIDLCSVKIVKGTRVKNKQDGAVEVDDHGYLFGRGINGSFFRIKTSKAEEKERLGLRVEIIYENAEVIFTTANPGVVRLSMFNSMEVIEIKLLQDKLIQDPEGELPFWSDSFYHMLKVWISYFNRGDYNKSMPSILDGVEVQRVIESV